MKSTGTALVTTLMLLLVPLSGCLQDDSPIDEIEEESLPVSYTHLTLPTIAVV